MIEYDESALGMIECVYTDWINGMSQGDMRKQEDFKNYRLSRDKKILNYIYQTIFYKGIMPSEKVLDFPVDCNTLTGSVNL